MPTFSKHSTSTKKITANYQALSVVKYLLSLDTSKNYFRVRIENEDNSLGSRRMNWMLHLLQIFYYAKYSELLFADEILAFEQGPIIYSVYKYFAENNNEWFLDLLNSVEDIKNSRDKHFIALCFHHFRTYSDKGLENLSKSDPAWFTVWQENAKDPRMNFTQKDNLEFYKLFCPNRLKWIEKAR